MHEFVIPAMFRRTKTLSSIIIKSIKNSILNKILTENVIEGALKRKNYISISSIAAVLQVKLIKDFWNPNLLAIAFFFHFVYLFSESWMFWCKSHGIQFLQYDVKNKTVSL